MEALWLPMMHCFQCSCWTNLSLSLSLSMPVARNLFFSNTKEKSRCKKCHGRNSCGWTLFSMAIRRTAGTARTRRPRRSCVIANSVSESLDELETSASATGNSHVIHRYHLDGMQFYVKMININCWLFGAEWLLGHHKLRLPVGPMLNM